MILRLLPDNLPIVMIEKISYIQNQIKFSLDSLAHLLTSVVNLTINYLSLSILLNIAA